MNTYSGLREDKKTQRTALLPCASTCQCLTVTSGGLLGSCCAQPASQGDTVAGWPLPLSKVAAPPKAPGRENGFRPPRLDADMWGCWSALLIQVIFGFSLILLNLIPLFFTTSFWVKGLQTILFEQPLRKSPYSQPYPLRLPFSIRRSLIRAL